MSSAGICGHETWQGSKPWLWQWYIRWRKFLWGRGLFYAMPVHSCTIPSSLLLNPHFRTLRNLKAQRGWQTSRGPHSVFSGRAGIRTCISCLVAGVFPTKPLFPDEVILDRTASHTLSEPQCGMWGRPRMRGTLASTVLFFCL